MASPALAGYAAHSSQSVLHAVVARPTQCRMTAPMQHLLTGSTRDRPCAALQPKNNFSGLCSARTRRQTAVRAAAPATTALPKEVEYSRMVNHELTLFLFQLDFDNQLQRALNYEKFDAVREIRSRRQQVDEALEVLQSAKGEGAGVRGGAHSEEAGLASEGLRLRSEMQRAAEQERYADAADIRDRYNALQTRILELTTAAGPKEDAPPRTLRLGQRVIHSVHGYRGAVCGWDTKCCESEAWQVEAGVAQLQRGAQQPFYHVLVDSRDWQDAEGSPPPMVYVAQELLCGPEEGSTWVKEYGDDPFSHPYSYLLFLGTDYDGDLLPSRAMREKYSAARRDVGPPSWAVQEDSHEDSDAEDGSGPRNDDFNGV